MATNTTTPFKTLAAQWPRLQPAVDPDSGDARTIHGKLPPSVSYAAGTAVGRVLAVANRWAVPGAGVGPAIRLLEYQVTTNASGEHFYGPTANAEDSRDDSIPMWYQGKFYCKDIPNLTAEILPQLGPLVQGVAFDDPTAIVRIGVGPGIPVEEEA
jgi:hypothetical protein